MTISKELNRSLFTGGSKVSKDGAYVIRIGGMPATDVS